MKILGQEVNKHVIIPLYLIILFISLGLKSYSSKDYWSLGIPSSIKPYVERGIVKEVYVLKPNEHKEYIRQLSVMLFLTSIFLITFYLIVLIILTEGKESNNNFNNFNKGKKDNSNNTQLDQQQKSINEIKTFILTYPITILLCNNIPPTNTQSIIYLYINLLKTVGYQVSYGEVGKTNETTLSLQQGSYIGQLNDRIKDRINLICAEVNRFKEERESRVDKGNKEAMVLNEVNKIITLSEEPKELINNLVRISSMGLHGYEMKLLLVFNNQEDCVESIERMGGGELGIIEFKGTKSHITLRTQGKDDKTLLMPTKESIQKHLNSQG